MCFGGRFEIRKEMKTAGMNVREVEIFNANHKLREIVYNDILLLFPLLVLAGFETRPPQSSFSNVVFWLFFLFET